jgi:hypothetical protein
MVDNNLIDVTNIYIDSTHVRASANNKKYIKKVVEVSKGELEKELDEDIQVKRDQDGHKPLKKN